MAAQWRQRPRSLVIETQISHNGGILNVSQVSHLLSGRTDLLANDWWLFLLVPLFAASLGVWFRADYRSRDLLVMVVVASAGYAVSFFLGNVSDITPGQELSNGR